MAIFKNVFFKDVAAATDTDRGSNCSNRPQNV